MPIIHREDGVPPSKSRFVTMGGAFDDIVNSFATHTKTFTPPRGKRWQVLTMHLKKGFPTGGSSGTHNFNVKQAGATMLSGESIFSTNVNWDTNRWQAADSAQAPTSETAALIALHHMIADAEHPFTIEYNNLTDAQNTKSGTITIDVLETPII